MKRALIPILFFMVILPLVGIAHAETNTTSTSSSWTDILNEIMDFLKSLVKTIFTAPKKAAEAIQSLFNALRSAITGLLSTIKDAVTGFFDTLWTAITYPFHLLYNGIMSFVSGVKKVFSTIASALGYAGGSIKDVVSNAASWLKNNVYVLFLAAAGLIAIRYAIAGYER